MGDKYIFNSKPDWEAFIACLQHKGTPKRVHLIELLMDAEIQDAICQEFNLLDGLNQDDLYFNEKKLLRIQRFLGYDYVNPNVEGLEFPLYRTSTEDTAIFRRDGGRSYVNESRGPITNWDEFEKYPWPDPNKISTRSLEWFEQNLPDDMCVLSWGVAHFAEYISWLMGYETMCFALYEQRELVEAISNRLLEIFTVVIKQILDFSRVKVIFGSDDMGFKNGTLISPKDLREFVLPGHKIMAELTHQTGRLYILHSCGNLARIMNDLINDIGIDGKHSFEDTIEDVRDVKLSYGQQIAILGGIDMDFLCRSRPEEIRKRVSDTLEICQQGGGYCLGTGNTVANYIPLENYLTMLDEGHRWR